MWRPGIRRHLLGKHAFQCGAALVLGLIFFFGWTTLAQLTTTSPELQQREGSSVPQTAAASPDQTPLSEYQKSQMEAWANDFANLARYRAADAALRPPSAGVSRVIFFGDSITDMWDLDTYFPGKGYINRGISGQTTSQMLLRFRQDVIDLQPKVVVILAGTNDIAGNTGPIPVKDVARNLESMAELARVHHISVIFSSVTPVSNYVPASIRFFNQRPSAEIIDMNAWLKNYCASNGFWYLNYFNALVDQQGMLKQGLSADGLHPNDAGYRIMAPLAESMIEKAITR